MKLIKAAITYKATIPTAVGALTKHLEEKTFAECTEMQVRSVGFVPPCEDDERLVQTFPGGLAFAVRIDEKIIPASTVKAEVEKRAASIKADAGRKPGKHERAKIRDAVMADLCRRALVKTKAKVTCFYDEQSGYLIVPTSSKAIADICTSLLVQAVGSVKTETINVADVKHGLTTRLKKWLDDGECGAFGDFDPCDSVTLATTGKKITVKMESLDLATRGLQEAVTAGFSVTSIGFHYIGMDFRLTDDFHMKGIYFADSSIPKGDEEDPAEDPWATAAAMQVSAVSAAINVLVELLSYKDEPEGGAS